MVLHGIENDGLFDSDGVINTDHLCRQCEYNLRGLREGSICPECGSPISISFRDDFLRFANPYWMQKVARGLFIILLMTVVRIIAHGSNRHIGLQASEIISFLAKSVGYYGAWLLTTPEPTVIGKDPSQNDRLTVRVALAIGLVGSFIGLFMGDFSSARRSRTGTSLYVGLMLLTGLAGEAAKYKLYERLAMRIPNESLTARARFLYWAYPVSLLFFYIFSYGKVFAFLLLFINPLAFLGFGCIASTLAACVLIFGLLTVALLSQLRMHIGKQIKIAREHMKAPAIKNDM